MDVLTVRNVHLALPAAIQGLEQMGQERESRNGPVRLFPGPVTTVYRRPCERVIFWPERDANPFFHLFEALWMLDGRQDVEYLSRFNSNIARYSDDGEVFHGAYGFRWRHLRGIDQLEMVIERLREDPTDRRQVVQMFDAEFDLLEQEGRKDIPCNLTICFQRDFWGRLEMTVFNRSNDLIWGCYGANAVHFSVLQEYVATMIGCDVGFYRQVSCNLHAYLETLEPLKHMVDLVNQPTPYNVTETGGTPEVKAYPLITKTHRWNLELKMFLAEGNNALGYEDPFFRKIALPMLAAWDAFKADDSLVRFVEARTALTRMPPDCDWYKACDEWLTRRQERATRKAKAEEENQDE